MKQFAAGYRIYYEPKASDDIRWNFEKFLINERGHPVRRYLSSLDPLDMVPDIDNLLGTMQQEKKSSKTL